MERFNLGIEIAEKVGKYLNEKINKSLKLKEMRYDVKLLEDMESEKIIIEEIKKFFSEDSFLCEETGINIKDKNNLWIIDPLDGSFNFSRGIPHFCISIAFKGEKEEFGIVYDFFKREMFTGIKEKGAFLNGKKIEVSKTERIEDAIVAIGFMRSEKELNYGLDLLSKITKKVKKIRIMGSASLDLCYLACGRIDLTFHLNVKRWDYEAGKIILEEAGGKLEKKQVDGFEIFKGTNKKIEIEI